MLFTFERFMIRRGSCVIRQLRFLSSEASSNLVHQEEFVLKPEDRFTVVRREESKTLNIAILGYPNAGKSTIINRLIDRSVCAVSAKAHTTTHKSEAVLSAGDTQLIFMDTPGLVSPKERNKFKLKNSFETDPKTSMASADIVGVVQDASNIYTRSTIGRDIKGLIQNKRKNAALILILNKIDKVKKKYTLLEVTRMLKNQDNSIKFDDVFMVSALNGDGIDDLRIYLLDSAKSNSWKYTEETYSNQSKEQIVEETVRAKLLDALPNEIPYQLQVKLESLEVFPDGGMNIVVTIKCPKTRIGVLLLKGKGIKLKNIARESEEALRHAFQTSLVLRICVDFPNRIIPFPQQLSNVQ